MRSPRSFMFSRRSLLKSIGVLLLLRHVPEPVPTIKTITDGLPAIGDQSHFWGHLQHYTQTLIVDGQYVDVEYSIPRIHAELRNSSGAR